jgi:hypothetical protein
MTDELKYCIRYQDTQRKNGVRVMIETQDGSERRYTLAEARLEVKSLIEKPSLRAYEFRIEPFLEEGVSISDPRIERYVGWLKYDWTQERPDRNVDWSGTPWDEESPQLLVVVEDGVVVDIYSTTSLVAHVLDLDAGGVDTYTPVLLSEKELFEQINDLLQNDSAD